MFRKLLVKNSAAAHGAAERLLLNGGNGRMTSLVLSSGIGSKVANRPPKILITGNLAHSIIYAFERRERMRTTHNVASKLVDKQSATERAVRVPVFASIDSISFNACDMRYSILLVKSLLGGS